MTMGTITVSEAYKRLSTPLQRAVRDAVSNESSTVTLEGGLRSTVLCREAYEALEGKLGLWSGAVYDADENLGAVPYCYILSDELVDLLS